MIRRLFARFRRTRPADSLGISDRELEQLLRETFEDYLQSIRDVFDANPGRCEEAWRRAQFDAVTRSLERDRTLKRLDRQLNRRT